MKIIHLNQLVKSIVPVALIACGLFLASCSTTPVKPVPLTRAMDEALFDPINGPTVSAWTQRELQDGRKAMSERRFEDAIRIFEDLAARGYPDAAYELGKIYKYGRGVPENSVLAAEWLKAAIVVRNDHRAQAAYHYGEMLAIGDGVPRQPEKAMRLLQLAYDADVVEAAFPIGQMIIRGNGVPKDTERGLALIRESAERGNIDAQFWLLNAYGKNGTLGNNPSEVREWVEILIPALQRKIEQEDSAGAMLKLGEIYHRGLGRPIDAEKALMWYERAAAAGSPYRFVQVAQSMVEHPKATPDVRKRGIEYLRKAADAYDSANAKLILGDAYYQGLGVNRDRAAAREWYAKAAADGLPRAQLAYGRMLIEKPRTDEQVAEAVKMFRKAGNAGNIYAVRELGELNLDKAFPEADPALGVELLTKAHDKGVESAAALLGRAYLDGETVPKDVQKARKWLETAVGHGDRNAELTLSRAVINGEIPGDTMKSQAVVTRYAQQGDELAMMSLARAYRDGAALPQDMRMAQFWFERALQADAEGAKDSLASVIYLYAQKNDGSYDIEGLRRAADLGHTGAMAALGRAYLDGEGVEQDSAKAVEMLQGAAEEGHVGAMATLGDAMLFGRQGVPVDKDQGRGYLVRAAESGHTFARRTLGEALLTGDHIAQDTSRGITLLWQAAEDGDSYAMTLLGTAYLQGRGGIDPNAKLAERWLTRAADHGDLYSLTLLGQSFMSGEVIRRDVKKGLSYLEKAAKKGDATAQFMIGRAYIHGDDGVDQDLDLGIEYLTKGVEQGHIASMAELGRVYITDEYGRRDVRKGAEYLYRAAKAGHETATVSLAKAYLKSRGIEHVNARYADAWLSDVLHRDSEVAIRTLTEMLQDSET